MFMDMESYGGDVMFIGRHGTHARCMDISLAMYESTCSAV